MESKASILLFSMNAEFYKIAIVSLYASYYYIPPKPHFSTRVPIFSLSYDKHAEKLSRE